MTSTRAAALAKRLRDYAAQTFYPREWEIFLSEAAALLEAQARVVEAAKRREHVLHRLHEAEVEQDRTDVRKWNERLVSANSVLRDALSALSPAGKEGES